MAIRNLPDIWRSERQVWNPMREVSRLQRRIDRMFEDFFSDPSRDLLSGIGMSVPSAVEFTPLCDVDETEKNYLVTLDLPGMKKDEVKVEMRGDQLVISGERKQEQSEKGRRERFYGTFSRSFTLPPNASADRVEASYDNGVLQIAIPKTAVAPGKQIPVKEGKLIEARSQKAA